MPKGIRWRGADAVLVDVYRNGKRSAETLRRAPGESDTDLIARARKRRAEKEAEMLGSTPGPAPSVPCWTLQQAYDHVAATPAHDGGWAGTGSEATSLKNGRDVVAWFGADRRLDTIDAEDIKEWRARLLADGAKATTANRKVAALSKLMTQAAENPRRSGFRARPRFPRRLDESGSRRTHTFSREQEDALVAWLRQRGEHDAADVAEVLFDTGMRIGELWHVRARHVSLDEDTVLLTGADDAGTKNGGWRTILIPTDRVRRILRGRLTAAGDDAEARLFPYNNDWLRWRWDLARKALGLTGRDYCRHGARHTYVTRELAAGTDSMLVRKLVGHRSLHITSVYDHVGTGDLRALRRPLRQDCDTPADLGGQTPPSDLSDQGRGAGIAPETVAKLLQSAASGALDQQTLMYLASQFSQSKQ